MVSSYPSCFLQDCNVDILRHADYCIIAKVLQHRIHLVETDDKDLGRRLRKMSGVPLVGVGKGDLS